MALSSDDFNALFGFYLHWLGVELSEMPEGMSFAMGVLRAAVARVEKRCNLPSTWVTDNDDIKVAVVMQGSRLYKRRATPEGIAQFAESGIIRLSSLDHDIEGLLSDYLKAPNFR